MFLRELNEFEEQLEDEIIEIKGELESLFDGSFGVGLVSRSDGTAKKYYWRFKSSKKDRKFHRLSAYAIQEYIQSLDLERKRFLKEVEENIIYINANIKLIKNMRDGIEGVIEDQRQLEVLDGF